MDYENPKGVINKGYFQQWGTGEFIVKGKAVEDYYNFAKEFPYMNNAYSANGGDAWWKLRKAWIDRLLSSKTNQDDYTSERNPFAIELCPWHSKGFAGFGNKNEADFKKFIQYLKEYVFDFTEKAIENSELGFAISVGKAVVKCLQLCEGVEPIENMEVIKPTDTKKYRSLLKKGDTFICREYSLWKLPSGKLMLNTSSQGSNKAPSGAWSAFEKEIIDNSILPEL